MTIVYRSKQPLNFATIAFKPANPNSSDNPGLIAKELFTHLSVGTASPSELSVTLPATPGLTNIKEVVITHEPKTAQPVDLVIERFTVKPTGSSLVSTTPALVRSSRGIRADRADENQPPVIADIDIP
jgi:hypothetical protein